MLLLKPSAIEDRAGTRLAPLRAGMIITSIAAGAGGVAEAARSLTQALHRRPDTEVEVFSMSQPDPAVRQSWGGAELRYHPVRGPNSFSYAPGLRRSLSRRPIDLLHLHGLWQYPSIASHTWQVRTGRPCLVSPHGMLDAWALENSRWKKRIAGVLFENDNLRDASCLHALCAAELQAIRNCGLGNPVCIIPNGVDPAPATVPDPPVWRRALAPEARVLLYLGRLHPKKNLIELLHGWRSARLGNTDGRAWQLVIAGSGSTEYERRLNEEIGQLCLADNARLVGPQYGPDKHATLAWSEAFILPSLSEGLPMSALEAWSWGLPALLTPECNLPEGYSAGAAMPTGCDRGSIGVALGQLFALSGERRRQMGRRGLELTSSRFAWSRIAEEFRCVYGWLKGTAERPDCVATV